MAKLTGAQRQYIRKKTKVEELDPSEMAGELNIIPFLDIVVNLIMFLLMTTSSVLAVVQIETQLPSYKRGVGGRASAPQEPSLNLNVTVTENGVIVTGSGGKLAPGCTTTASGRVLTVPKKGKDYDWAALTSCAAQVKSEFPDETQVIVSADPLIEFETVVLAMDALRAQDDKELFPQVLLSGGVR